MADLDATWDDATKLWDDPDVLWDAGPDLADGGTEVTLLDPSAARIPVRRGRRDLYWN